MALTLNDLIELRVGVARAIAAESNAVRKAELQAEQDALERDQARIIAGMNASLKRDLEQRIARVEKITRELADITILDAIATFQARAGLKRAAELDAAGAPAPAPAPAPATEADRIPPPGGAVIDPDWKPAVQMDRIICHWTAGTHKASALDRFHYHILIEDDGVLIRGTFSIADNVANLVFTPRSYAAHTKGTNTRAIGVAMCCMADAEENPFDAGPHPMTEVQWNRMIDVVADLCRTYGIPVTPQTVLGHGEVQANLGNLQDGKWDPMVLPFNTALGKAQVGDLLRNSVQAKLN